MAQESQTRDGEAAMATTHVEHPTPLTYFKVAMALAAITAVEVGVFYVEDLGKGIIPVLAVLSATKFALVAMFYMHLRYEARLFSGLFVGGLALAVVVSFALLGLFRFFG
jgi:cytochrome c oxidase subunit 4